MSGAVFWLFGLSGAGKSTVARAMVQRWSARGQDCLNIDGDELRQGLCKDLGFTLEDRMENVRRAAELARMACLQGRCVFVALMTPRHAMRELAREILHPLPFLPIHLDCNYRTCEARDPKGLYQRVAQGQVRHFVGHDLAFEPAATGETVVDTQNQTLEATLDVVDRLVADTVARPQAGPAR